jgi:uncharacterized membrane protein HdeD (DUF308 family)
MATEIDTGIVMTRETFVPWWLILLQGIATAILGVLLITQTGITLATLTIFLGVYWFVLGVIDLVHMFTEPAGWGWKLFSGVVGILAGLVLIRHPLWSAAIGASLLVWIVGGLGLLFGIVEIIRSFTGGGWGMALAGLLSAILGLLLLFHTAVTVVVLINLVGIVAIVGGVIAIVTAIVIRAQGGAGSRRMAY